MKTKQLINWLEGWLSTSIGAVFLAASLGGILAEIPCLEYMAWGCIILSGTPLLIKGLTRLWNRKLTSALLISIAMVASICIGELFAAGEVAFIMALGGLLEHATVERSRRSLARLLSLNPVQARLIHEDGREEMIATSAICPGALLRVKPGETIPADGVVTAGTSGVNQSILTGESLPVDCGEGSQVFAGTHNGEGSLDIRVEKEPGDTTLQRLIALVKEAGERRAPIAREADRWASRLVPAALLVAIVGFVVLLLMGYPIDEARLRAVTVLVVFCPCALVLATPTAMMAAIGQATKKGVIIKSGEALETLGRVKLICFDKTGTLTLGKLRLHEVLPFGVSKSELIRLAAALESRSEHPLARAILAANGDTPLPEPTNFRALPGRGVTAEVEGQHLLCASEAGLQDAGVKLTEEQEKELVRLRGMGYASILVARGNACIGLLALGDTLRPETPLVLSSLGRRQRVLLTGDHAAAASHMAQGLALDCIHSGLLPHEKVERVQQFQREGQIVAMVGDGVNDAPALRQANVGISMSRLGSDIATEAADFALMNDELTRLPYLMRLAHSSLNTIRFNIAASLIINAVAVTLSLLGMLTPITGALVHNAGSLLVILNAALLYDRRFD